MNPLPAIISSNCVRCTFPLPQGHTANLCAPCQQSIARSGQALQAPFSNPPVQYQFGEYYRDGEYCAIWVDSKLASLNDSPLHFIPRGFSPDHTQNPAPKFRTYLSDPLQRLNARIQILGWAPAPVAQTFQQVMASTEQTQEDTIPDACICFGPPSPNCGLHGNPQTTAKKFKSNKELRTEIENMSMSELLKKADELGIDSYGKFDWELQEQIYGKLKLP